MVTLQTLLLTYVRLTGTLYGGQITIIAPDYRASHSNWVTSACRVTSSVSRVRTLTATSARRRIIAAKGQGGPYTESSIISRVAGYAKTMSWELINKTSVATDAGAETEGETGPAGGND